jgi:uncharacterized protein YndB with AHSA1/START domain
MAATRFHVARTIDAPPERIWELLTDAPSYTDWNPTIVRLDGTIDLGSRIELVSVVNPKRAFKLEVTELEPPRRMVWSQGMPLGLFTGRRTFALDPGNAGTAFSMTEEFTGPLAGMIARSVPDLTPSFEQFADALEAAA